MTAQNDFTRRKWPRISLRMFLLVVAVFCVWMGVRTNRARHQRELVGRILELGGTIGYGHEYDRAGNRVTQPKSPGPAWLRKSIGDEYFVDVVRVALPDGAEV